MTDTMRTLELSEIARGFFLTLFVAVVLPWGSLAIMPSSGIALLLVPLCTASTVLVFLSGSVIRRRVGCALSPLSLFAVPQLAFSAECGQGYAELQPPSIRRPTNVVFDNVSNSSVRRFADSSVMLRLIKQHNVFEIERGPSGTLQESWQFSAENFDNCIGPDRSKVVFSEPVPEERVPANLLPYRLPPDPASTQQPSHVSTFSYCLWRSSVPVPNGNAEAIIIRGSYASEKAADQACRKIDVLQRSDGNEKLLGSFELHGVSKLMPAPPGIDVSSQNWLNVIVSEVFGIKFAFETNKE